MSGVYFLVILFAKGVKDNFFSALFILLKKLM